MDVNARIGAIEASLIALGIDGLPLDAIINLVRIHARPEPTRQMNLAFASRHDAKGLGEIAAEFLVGSLRRKELLGHAADDPSWNMLLALFSDEERGAQTSVSSACYASGAAPTTALRHIDALVRSGLVKRTPDPTDLRRSFLAATPSTNTHMAALIRSFCVAPPA